MATSGPPFWMYSGRRVYTKYATPMATRKYTGQMKRFTSGFLLHARRPPRPFGSELAAAFPFALPAGGWRSLLVLLRLREARDRLVLAVVHIEAERQLGDDEDVLDPLVHAAQLQLTLPLGLVRVPGDEHTQGSRVDVLGLAEVDDQVQVALGRQVADELLQLVRLLASHQVATGRGNHDPVQPLHLHVLHPVLRRKCLPAQLL